MNKKRDIFIKLDEIKNIIKELEELKELQNQTKELFKHYENISSQENKVFENWNNYIEDIEQRVDHLTI